MSVRHPHQARLLRRGTRLTVHHGQGSVVVRTCADVVIDGPWHVVVLAEAPVPTLADAWVELTTGHGVAAIPVRLDVAADGMVLSGGRATVVRQRRSDVRGAVQVRVHAAQASDGPDFFVGPIVSGETVDLSAGGLRAVLPNLPAGIAVEGAATYVELTLPDDSVVQALGSVVRYERGTWQVHFHRIDPGAADRLARLVFAAERRMLAERARRADRARLLHGHGRLIGD